MSEKLQQEMRFAEVMTALRAFYPHMKIEDDWWDKSISAYFVLLGEFGPDIWGRMVKRAVKAHPNFFPTAPQLLVICEDLQKTHEGAEMRLLLTEGSGLGDENPFEKLARALESGEISGADAPAAVAEALGSSGAEIFDNTTSDLEERYGPVNEDAFCPACGKMKLNHGLWVKCHMRWGSKFEPEDESVARGTYGWSE